MRGREAAAGTPMPPLDAWLHRHQSSGAVCMTVALLARFTGPAPEPDGLRSLVEKRWSGYGRLRLVVGGAERPEWPRWTSGAWPDPVRHVIVAPDGPPEEHVARLLARPLGPERPPWRLHLLPGGAGEDGFALLLRAHHALLDGRSLLALVRDLLDGPPAVPGQARAILPAPRRRPLHALSDLLPRARPLPFHGPVDARRAVAWRRVTGAELDAARDALPSGRASANAVFLAGAAGALRTAEATGRLPFLPGVCAMVPVDVRPVGEAAVLGNHYATVRVPLPAGGGPGQRLAVVDGFTRRAATRERARAQALAVAASSRRHGPVTDALGRYVDSPLYASVLCSSLAERTGPLALGAARLTGLSLLPPLSPGHPLALTMTRDTTGATLAVITDHGRRALADRLAALLREEILALGR
ncbi:wax ester/triacylglycerol synthase domain-containing protein [Streptomyces sp. CA-181903]|uniref:wax ester/triacylglycerol synthase domain-containing protein n=1 Tax=Streptomyces sp. CA-181903 TaxID=3240055 RepID=UPI003D8EAEFB